MLVAGVFTGEVAPLGEVVGLKCTILVTQYHLGLTLEEERECSFGGTDIDCLPQPVEHQHLRIYDRCHVGPSDSGRYEACHGRSNLVLKVGKQFTPLKQCKPKCHKPGPVCSRIGFEM